MDPLPRVLVGNCTNSDSRTELPGGGKLPVRPIVAGCEAELLFQLFTQLSAGLFAGAADGAGSANTLCNDCESFGVPAVRIGPLRLVVVFAVPKLFVLAKLVVAGICGIKSFGAAMVVPMLVQPPLAAIG